MAPVPSRPSRAHLIPRQSEPAPSTPAEVTQLIPRKLFLQLLAGTVCIFVLAVLFWRLGRFLRFFTKGKVLREGNNPTTRYTKTWYGWVSSERHEARKKAFRNCLRKIHGLAAWRSSKADHQWVWWDPGQRQAESYRMRREQWVPGWIRSSSFTAADTMWNPGRFDSHSAIAASGARTPSFMLATGALLSPNTVQPVTHSNSSTECRTISIQEDLGDTVSASALITRQLRGTEVSSNIKPVINSYPAPYRNNRFLSLGHSVDFPISKRFSSFSVRCSPRVSRSLSMPCLPHPGCFATRSDIRLCEMWKSESADPEAPTTELHPNLRRTRKYQIWSARMGFQTLKGIGYSTHTLPGAPPGSPKSALLGSLSFGSGAFDQISQYQQVKKSKSFSTISILSFHSVGQPYSVDEAALEVARRDKLKARGWHSAPFLGSPSPFFHRPMLLTSREHLQRKQKESTARAERAGMKDGRGARNAKKTLLCTVEVKDLSDWEVRLIDNLDRRLEWLSNQLSPGKRPFHFALLANHWLNRKTWIVIEPASRVPIDMRRHLGDPRFNVPYPAPTWDPKPKYPRIYHRPAHNPKICSWRAAVNKHRRASGLREFIRRIELYDSSAEDPPDGDVDPASWILRRPPQGFGLSARQRANYYEGGTGWQEKLSDWQRVRHGYRIRKAIYEGRVNRTKARQIAYSISRYYRQATSILFHIEANGRRILSTVEQS